MKNMLIIGSEGFIGSYIGSELDYLFNISDVDTIDYVCKINEQLVRDDHRLKECDYILHLGAYPVNDNSYRHFESIETTRIILDSISPRTRLIYASTMNVYDQTLIRSDEENTLGIPSMESFSHRKADTLYEASKIICEDMIINKSDNYTILRLGNVYGHGMRHGVIYDWKNKLKSGTDTVFLNSTSITTGGQKHTFSSCGIRPFIHVDKIVEVIDSITSRDESITKNQIFNVCGTPVDLIDLANMFNLKIEKRHGNISVYSGSFLKMMNELQVMPSTYSDLENFIKDYIK